MLPLCAVHVVGFVSTALSPPRVSSTKLVNGTCGWLLNVVLTWPLSLTLTSPASFTRRPNPSSTMKSFHGFAGVGRPTALAGPKKALPSSGGGPSAGSGFGRTGDLTVTVPIWDPCGHLTGSELVRRGGP